MRGSLIPTGSRVPSLFDWMDRDMTRLFDRFAEPTERWGNGAGFVPSVNVAETETEYEVTVDVPGIDPKELKVEIRDGGLIVSGEKKEEKEEKGKTWHRVERHYGKFQRVVPFDLPVDRDKVDAKYHDGVLTIKAAKTAEASPKKIKVQT